MSAGTEIKSILYELLSLLQRLATRRRPFARFLVAGFVLLGLALAVLLPPFRAPDESTHWRLAATRLDRLLHPSHTCTRFGDLGIPFLFPPHAPAPHDHFAANAAQPPGCSPQPRMYGGLLTYPGAVLSLLLFTGETSHGADYVRAYFIGRILQGLLVALVMWRVATLMLDKGTVGALLILGFTLAGLSLQESFSITADGVGFAFALMLCAAMTSLDRFRAMDVALFAFVGYCTSIAKPFLAPVILPAIGAGFVLMRQSVRPRPLVIVIKELLKLFVPRRRPSVLHAMAWVGFALCVVSVLATRADFDSLPMKGNPAAQKAFILSNPSVFLFDLPQSVLGKIDNLDSYNGPLSLLDADISPRTVAHFRHLLFALGLFEIMLVIPRLPLLSGPAQTWGSREAARPLARRPWLSILLACLSVVAAIAAGFYGVIASLYLTWTPPGYRFLTGFQSRYAIPFVLLLLGVFAAGLTAVFPPRAHAKASSEGKVANIASLVIAAVLLALVLAFLSGLYFDLSVRFA